MEYQITLGDCVKFAREYKGEKFHAILCDPPYHLTATNVQELGRRSYDLKELRQARKKGFMGKQWDGGDVAFDPETWKAFKHILYSGAFGMAFASSRGWHRLAVAIEDAGFIIHPSLFGWVYGSGFPKATRIDTQIDSSVGIELNHGKLISKNRSMSGGNYSRDNKHQAQSDLAKIWQGHRYGLQALKPALEPIIVFQKPYQGKAIENITKTGAGALNIEGGRITTDDNYADQWDKPVITNISIGKYVGGDKLHQVDLSNYKPSGRWPANFYLDSELTERLDKQSININDGNASNFFFQVSQNIDESDPIYYCAKSSADERDAGLKEFSKDKAGGMSGRNDGSFDGHITYRHNVHPTVKPIDLNQYLATLLLPPAEYSPRRLFVPFSGVASEMIGGMLAGWDFIQGVELTEEYIPIAQARMEYWKNKPRNLEMFTQSEIKKMEEKQIDQLSLFGEENES